MINKKYLLICVACILLFLVIWNFIDFLILIAYPNEGVRCISISDSYSIWFPRTMKRLIQEQSITKYNAADVIELLNRSYNSIYIEWWLHNIGYYITKPFCFNKKIYEINLRCKDVDLEEWVNTNNV